MTLTRFATKNAFRNRRRSFLTAVSIAFSLLLLTLLMSIYRGFYLTQGSPESNLRLVTRHKVSLVFFLPSYYREKVRTIPGVEHVTPWNWFGGIYKDQKPENFFAQFGMDPNEFFDVQTDSKIAPDQLEALQHDRAGCAVTRNLAQKHGWKIGDRVIIKGTIYPVDLDLTVRAIYDPPDQFDALLFSTEYIDQALPRVKGRTGTLYTRVDSPEHVTTVARAVDAMFENSPQPTKTESEKAFGLSFVMTIRERTREVAVLKTLGFTKATILSLYVSEAVTISAFGGLLGATGATLLLIVISKMPNRTFFGGFKVNGPTFIAALAVAALVGLVSAIFPAYQASERNIVDGLRHIG